jgi:V-type H+-transporting ATPase subunit A
MYKTMGMMKAIVKFFDNCIRIIENKKVSMGYIESTQSGLLYELSRMKFQSPADPEQETRKYFDDLHTQIDDKFREMTITAPTK